MSEINTGKTVFGIKEDKGCKISGMLENHRGLKRIMNYTEKRREKKNTFRGGYMSVEAAVIVPLAFFIMVWLIYVGFFEYNRCLIFQDDYSLAVKTSSHIANTTEQQSFINRQVKTQLGNKYIGIPKVSMTGVVSGNKLKVKSNFSSSLIANIKYLISPRLLTVSDEVNADNYSCSKRLRAYRSVGRIINGGK